MSSGILRVLQRSQFDHVAMVLKFDSDENEIYLVEATGNRGVALNKWEFLRTHVGTGQFYEKIVYRHVDFERNNEMVDNLEIFLKEALG